MHRYDVDRWGPQLVPFATGPVIVADDDAAMRRLVAEALRRDGYRVEEARSGSELLESVACRASDIPPIELIVSDHRMPTVTGLEIARGLRSGGWQIPIILMTAFGDRTLHDDARLAGVVAVFDKPFELDDLRTVARIVLSTPRDLMPAWYGPNSAPANDDDPEGTS